MSDFFPSRGPFLSLLDEFRWLRRRDSLWLQNHSHSHMIRAAHVCPLHPLESHFQKRLSFSFLTMCRFSAPFFSNVLAAFLLIRQDASITFVNCLNTKHKRGKCKCGLSSGTKNRATTIMLSVSGRLGAFDAELSICWQRSFPLHLCSWS